jgi:class 3 adenylate cyclase
MVGERLERRLSAIFAADVVGYSRLTGADEEGTHFQLQDHLRSFVDPKIAEHRSHIVKNTGDGMLAESGSVVDAMLALSMFSAACWSGTPPCHWKSGLNSASALMSATRGGWLRRRLG